MKDRNVAGIRTVRARVNVSRANLWQLSGFVLDLCRIVLLLLLSWY